VKTDEAGCARDEYLHSLPSTSSLLNRCLMS
jgi:hypothetical protein